MIARTSATFVRKVDQNLRYFPQECCESGFFAGRYHLFVIWVCGRADVAQKHRFGRSLNGKRTQNYFDLIVLSFSKREIIRA